MNHKRNLIKAICLTLLAALLLSGCVVGGTQEEEPAETTAATTLITAPPTAQNTILSIGCCLKTAYNPITDETSVNEGLCSLTADGLFAVGEGFLPEERLCESIVSSGAEYKIVMRTDAIFSDGTAVTAADAVYSLELARTSKKYSQRFEHIKSITEGGNGTLLITLDRQRDGITVLLDVPIIKKNTGKDSDAVCCGPYVLTRSGEDTYLLPFSDYYRGSDETEVGHIQINSVTTEDELLYGLISGNVDVFRADRLNSEGIEYNAYAESYPVETASLFCAIINVQSEQLSSESTRQALSAAVDREALCASALKGSAVPNSGLFPKSLYPSLSEIAGSSSQSLAGLSLRLLCDGSNAVLTALAGQLADQLAAAGITVETQALEGSAYKKAVKEGSFELLVTLLEPGADFDYSRWFASDGAENLGHSSGTELGRLLLAFSTAGASSGGTIASQLVSAYASYAPAISIGFKTDAVLINRSFKITNVRVTAYNMFYNVFDWKIGK